MKDARLFAAAHRIDEDRQAHISASRRASSVMAKAWQTNASFYPVFSSFWNLIPFSLPVRPVSALDGVHLIKFCTFLSPFRMGLTNPGRALGRSCLLSISLKLLTLSGIPPFSTNSFQLASLFALLVGLNLSFLIGALLWFIKITKVVPFESVEVFRKDPFLALYFSLSSSMIFRLLCLLPSDALFTLTIWPFGPPPHCRRGHTRSSVSIGALV